MSDIRHRICLWYDGTAEEAANFYAETFPGSRIEGVTRAPGDYPDGEQGNVLVVEFTVLGIPAMGLNGGDTFKHYWTAIVGNGGEESQCGWCRDKWGVSWQITPRQLMEIYSDPDPAATKRAFESMMTMKKIDIATIEAARAGENA
jgi:predicted 3-demethylubiquinone-9 3-methyltransferase (glyoxalase superfamily)